jgi:hypothetical protein
MRALNETSNSYITIYLQIILNKTRWNKKILDQVSRFVQNIYVFELNQ